MLVCKVCGSTRTVHYGKIDKHTLRRCTFCSVVFRLENRKNDVSVVDELIVDDSGIWDEYERLYYPSRERTYLRVLDMIKTMAGRRLLDVGSALGWFMEMASQRGYETWGIEPSRDVSFLSKQRTGRPVQVAVVEHCPFSDKSFNVITLFDVLEHTVDPVISLREVRRLLKDDGVLVVRVPDYNGLIPRVSHCLLSVTRGRYSLPAWLLWRYHLWGFNYQSLTTLLQKMRFEILHEYSEDAQDLSTISRKQWASNPLLAFVVGVLVIASHLLRMQDEMVVIARRLPD